MGKSIRRKIESISLSGRSLFTLDNVGFYVSTGENSGEKGTIFPHLGVYTEAPRNYLGQSSIFLDTFSHYMHIFGVGYVIKPYSVFDTFTIENYKYPKPFDKLLSIDLKKRFFRMEFVAISAGIGGGFWNSKKGINISKKIAKDPRLSSFFNKFCDIDIVDASSSISTLNSVMEFKQKLISKYTEKEINSDELAEITDKDFIYSIKDKWSNKEREQFYTLMDIVYFEVDAWLRNKHCATYLENMHSIDLISRMSLSNNDIQDFESDIIQRSDFKIESSCFEKLISNISKTFEANIILESRIEDKNNNPQYINLCKSRFIKHVKHAYNKEQLCNIKGPIEDFLLDLKKENHRFPWPSKISDKISELAYYIEKTILSSNLSQKQILRKEINYDLSEKNMDIDKAMLCVLLGATINNSQKSKIIITAAKLRKYYVIESFAKHVLFKNNKVPSELLSQLLGSDDDELITLLLELGANPNLKLSCGESALIASLNLSLSNSAYALLKSPNINIQSQPEKLMLLAIENKLEQFVIDALLEYGLDIDWQYNDTNGSTYSLISKALHIGNYKAAIALLENGASTDNLPETSISLLSQIMASKYIDDSKDQVPAPTHINITSHSNLIFKAPKSTE